MGDVRNRCKILVRNLRRRNNLEEICVDVKTILKRILNKYDVDEINLA
jgi:hypothetical protein